MLQMKTGLFREPGQSVPRAAGLSAHAKYRKPKRNYHAMGRAGTPAIGRGPLELSAGYAPVSCPQSPCACPLRSHTSDHACHLKPYLCLWSRH